MIGGGVAGGFAEKMWLHTTSRTVASSSALCDRRCSAGASASIPRQILKRHGTLGLRAGPSFGRGL